MIKPPERRPPFYLLTGLIIGALIGFLSAFVFPAIAVDVSPASLSAEHKETYRLMVALSYAASGDLGRAQARLALIADGDPVRALASQAQVALTNNSTQREARALASLAADLDAVIDAQQATQVAVNTPNPDEQGEISTPFTTGAEDATYFLDNQELICESSQTPPMLKLFVFDANHNAQAGVRITVSSLEEIDEFVTGSKPEFGPGYADYVLTPGQQYTLSINGVEMMGGLQAAACETEAGEPAWGAWLMLFNAAE